MPPVHKEVVIDQELLAIDGATVASSGATGNVIDLGGLQKSSLQFFANLKNAKADAAEAYDFTLEFSDDIGFGSVDLSIDAGTAVLDGTAASETGRLTFGFVPNFRYARVNPQLTGGAATADIVAGFGPTTR